MENLITIRQGITSRKTITSLELVEQINLFRKEEGKETELRHDTMLSIIRDEFEEEISLQKILESKYKNERGREYPMFELTITQGKQVLLRESKFSQSIFIVYLRYRVIATASPRVATAYTLNSQPTSFKKTVLLQGF